jgi:hypothetical protein
MTVVVSQVEVKGKFWNASAGEVVTTARPNRLQSQKHQINSLAFQVCSCYGNVLCFVTCPV